MKTTDENLDYRFNIIKEVTTNKYYSNKQAAEDLGVCPRTICRLKKQFDGSIESLVHGNYQNNYSRKYSNELITKIVNFVKALNMQLSDKGLPPLNYKHALSKVRKELKLNITYSSFVKFMREYEILSHRSFAIDLGENTMHLPTQNKRRCGEEWQADGTFKFTINGQPQEYCFHLIVDSANNVMIAGYVDYEETTNGYLHAMKQGFDKYGIPLGFATDKRRSFHALCNNSKVDVEDRLTTITRILKDLDITIRVTSNPRSKNKVESKNALIKDRVLKEVALLNLNTIEEVNEAIPSILEEINLDLGNRIPQYNLHRTMPSNYNYDTIFAKCITRRISKNNTISYGNQDYILVCGEEILTRKPKTDIKLYINYKNEVFHIANNKRYELLIATREILKDYNLVNHSKLKRIMGKDKNTFTYMKHVYHLVDNNGVAVTFDERTEVELFYYKYNKKLSFKLACANKRKYIVKEGYPMQTEDQYQTEYRFTKNSLVMYNGVNYELHDMKCQKVQLKKDMQIMLEIKNRIPITGILNHQKYIIIPHQG